MATTGKSATRFYGVLFPFALMLLLATGMARSIFHGNGEVNVEVTPKLPSNCVSMRTVVAGDTCFDIAQQFHLTTPELIAINPNIVCDKLLVGQSICVAAGAAK